MVEDGADQVFKNQRRPRIKVPAPSAQVDSGYDHFAVSGLYQKVHIAENPRQGQRPALSAHGWNHAERTAVIAAVLHF